MNVDNNPKSSAASNNYSGFLRESLLQTFEFPKLNLSPILDTLTIKIEPIKLVTPPHSREYGYKLYETLKGEDSYLIGEEIIKAEMSLPKNRNGECLYKKEWLMCGTFHPALVARIILANFLEEGQNAWALLLDHWNLRTKIEIDHAPRTLIEVIYWLRQYPQIPAPSVEEANTLDHILGPLKSTPRHAFIERSLCCDKNSMPLDERLAQIILNTNLKGLGFPEEPKDVLSKKQQSERIEKLIPQLIMWGEFLTEAQFESIWNSYNINLAHKENENLVATLILFLPPRLLLTKTDKFQGRIQVEEQALRGYQFLLFGNQSQKPTLIQKTLAYAQVWVRVMLAGDSDTKEVESQTFKTRYAVDRRAFIKLAPLLSSDFMNESVFFMFIESSNIPIEDSIIAHTIDSTIKLRPHEQNQLLLIRCCCLDKIAKFLSPESVKIAVNEDALPFHILSEDESRLEKVRMLKKAFLKDVRFGSAKMILDVFFNMKMNYLMSQLPRLDSRAKDVSEVKKLLYTPKFFRSTADRFSRYPTSQESLRNMVLSFLNHALSSRDIDVVRAYLLRIITPENAPFIKPYLDKHHIIVDPADLAWIQHVNAIYLVSTDEWDERQKTLYRDLYLDDPIRLTALIDKYDYYQEFVLIFVDLFKKMNGAEIAPGFFRFITEAINKNKIPPGKLPFSVRTFVSSDLEYMMLIKTLLVNFVSTTWTIKEIKDAAEPGEHLLTLMKAVCENSVANTLSSQEELQMWMQNILDRPGGNVAFWTEAYTLCKAISQKVVVWIPIRTERAAEKGSSKRRQRTAKEPTPDFFAEAWARFKERIATADSPVQELKKLLTSKRQEILSTASSKKNDIALQFKKQSQKIQLKIEKKEGKLQESETATKHYLESKVTHLHNFLNALETKKSSLNATIENESETLCTKVDEASSIKNAGLLAGQLSLIRGELTQTTGKIFINFINAQMRQYQGFVKELKVKKILELKIQEHLAMPEPASLIDSIRELVQSYTSREAQLWQLRKEALPLQTSEGIEQVEAEYLQKRESLEADFKGQLANIAQIEPSVDRRETRKLEHSTKKLEESKTEIEELKAKLARTKEKKKLLKAERDASSSSESSPLPESLPGTDMETLRIRLIEVLTPIVNGQGAKASDAKAILKAIGREGKILKPVKQIKSILKRSGFTLNTDNGGSHRSTKAGATAWTLAPHSSQSKPEHKKDFLEGLLEVVKGWK